MLPMKSNLSLVTLKYLKNYLDAPILKMYPRSIVVDLRKIYELKCRVFVGNKCGLEVYIKEINLVQYLHAGDSKSHCTVRGFFHS